MGRELRWNNVQANPNAGMQYALQGSNLITRALDNLNKPLADYNLAQKENAKSQSDANTGAYKQAILEGEDPELSGAYDSNILADATRQFDRDEQADKLSNARLAIAQAGNRRQNRAEQRSIDKFNREKRAETDLNTLIPTLLGETVDQGVTPSVKDTVAQLASGAKTKVAEDTALPEVSPVEPAIPVDPMELVANQWAAPAANSTDERIGYPTPGGSNVVPQEQIAVPASVPENPAVNPEQYVRDNTDVSSVLSDDSIRNSYKGNIAVQSAIANLKSGTRAQRLSAAGKVNTLKATRDLKLEEAGNKRKQLRQNQVDRNLAFESARNVPGLNDFKPYVAKEGQELSPEMEAVNNSVLKVSAAMDDKLISKLEAATYTKNINDARALIKSTEDSNIKNVMSLASELSVKNNIGDTGGTTASDALQAQINEINVEREKFKTTAQDNPEIDAELKVANKDFNEKSAIKSWWGGEEKDQSEWTAGGENRRRKMVDSIASIFRTPAENKAAENKTAKINKDRLAAIEKEYPGTKKVSRESLVKKRDDKFQATIDAITPNLKKAQRAEKAADITLKKNIKAGGGAVLTRLMEDAMNVAEQAAAGMPGVTYAQIKKAAKKMVFNQFEQRKLNKAEKQKGVTAMAEWLAKEDRKVKDEIATFKRNQAGKKDIATFKNNI